MKRGIIVLAALSLLLSAGGKAAAAVISFVGNPTTNSVDFAAAVAGFGGSLNSNVNFDAHPVGALQNNFYTVSDGVTFSTTGPFDTIQFSAGPGQANTGPISAGEGVHAPSNFLFAAKDTPSTLTVSFADPVFGAGLYLIDLFNPEGRNPVSLQAFDGPDGTGTLLGSFNAVQVNFQQNRLYFMGVISTDADIRSIRLTNPATFADEIGVDDIVFSTAQAPIPEPASMALFCLGSITAGVCVGCRRRKRAVAS